MVKTYCSFAKPRICLSRPISPSCFLVSPLWFQSHQDSPSELAITERDFGDPLCYQHSPVKGKVNAVCLSLEPLLPKHSGQTGNNRSAPQFCVHFANPSDRKAWKWISVRRCIHISPIQVFQKVQNHHVQKRAFQLNPYIGKGTCL